ncbi:MAG: hypothetical protein J6X49_09275, partial [Victivallales bacterium]|nr:hypothetical protein [Victivallales bacterium]
MEQSKRLQYSAIAQSIFAGADNPDGDALIKKIFSNLEVLAWLLAKFIDEYKGCTPQEILEKYLPHATIDIGKIPVHAGEVSPESIPVANVEDKQLAEGTATFDVLLMLPVPNKPNKLIGVVIDIEVQKNDSPGYPIEARMVYYLCRSISRQRGLTFAGSDYGSICKCYSLWLCPELKEGEAPSIDRFRLIAERVYGEGEVTASKEDYDLLEGYTCRFNGDQSQSADEVIRFLQLLLTNIASPMERLDELHEKYGISKTREAEDMCNYSQFLIEKGKKEGREEGRIEGKEEGRIEGK